LEIDHDSHFYLGKLLGLLDHLDEDFVLLVLNGGHVDSEDVCALLNQFAYSFLEKFRYSEKLTRLLVCFPNVEMIFVFLNI
jgi:hypothetical protein